MSDDTSVDVLSRALDQTANLLGSIRPDQMDGPTPCDDWSVRRLLAHIVPGPAHFVTMSTGGEVDWSVEAPLPDDFVDVFRSSADDLLATWRDNPDAEGSADWQTAEFAVHAWDLAQAIGRTADLDPEVAERGLALMSSMLKPEMRGEVFKPEVEVPDDAPVYDRLAAFAGRDPRA